MPAWIVRVSTLACPRCAAAHTVTMPTDACQWYFECPSCHELLRPRPGDCCVFCSFGNVPCPPVQLRRRAQTDTPDTSD